MTVKTLDTVALFRSVSVEARSVLAERGRERLFQPGDVLMRQGDRAETMHVILSGRVRVSREQPGSAEAITLAELGPGSVVGEIGVLDGGPRTATVSALEATETLELHHTLLMVVLLQYPEVSAELLTTLSKRLRSTDQILDELAHNDR